MTDFEHSGCGVCRDSWVRHATIDEKLGYSAEYQTYVYRCVVCGTYWQEYGNWILAIGEDRATELNAN